MVANERKRIGLIIPSVNTVMEPDLYRHIPHNATLHTARMHIDEVTVAGEERMIDDFAFPAARDLSTIHPDIMVFGCTSGGALRGREYDRGLCAGISEVTKAPVVSTIETVNEALTVLNVRKVLVITPYVDELNERIKISIEGAGLEVIGIFGLGIADGFALAQVSPDEIVQFTKDKIQGLNPDCIFVSCTNFRAMEAIPQLKASFGLPVVTSNQAVLDKVVSMLSQGLTKPQS